MLRLMWNIFKYKQIQRLNCCSSSKKYPNNLKTMFYNYGLDLRTIK